MLNVTSTSSSVHVEKSAEGAAAKSGSTRPADTRLGGLNDLRRGASKTESAPPRVSLLGFASDLTIADQVEEPNGPHPYRMTGHVGYSLDGGKTIFGFGPASGLDRKATLAQLVARQTFPGKVSDDTKVFQDVVDTPQIPMSSADDYQTVYIKHIATSDQEFQQIKATHDARPLGVAMNEIPYGLPLPGVTAMNCATYPRSLGIPLPHPKGAIAAFVGKLKLEGEEWHPS